MILIIQFIFLSGAALFRIRWGLGIFIFMLSISPRSTALAIGSSNLAFTFQRAAILLLLTMLLLSSIQSRGMVSGSLVRVLNDSLVKTVLVLACIKILATMISIGASGILYAVDDALMTVGTVLIFAYFGNSRLFNIVMFSILLALLISFFMGVVETFVEKPLLSFIVDGTVYGTQSALSGLVRGNSYRLQAGFDNPLSLAEFAVYTLPFSLLGRHYFKGYKRFFCSVSLLMAGFLIFGTGARSGIIAAAVAIVTFQSALIWNRLSKTSRFVLLTFIIALFFYAAVQAFGFISVLSGEASNASFAEYEGAERSTLSRALQYSEVWHALQSSPLLGFGVRQNFANALDAIHRLDNYYLRLLLEGGLSALGLFAMLIFLTVKRINNINHNLGLSSEKLMFAFFVSFLASFLVMKLFISMPSNNIYIYSIVGILISKTINNKMALA